MDVSGHIDALRRDGERLGDAAELAGLEAPVPTCPGWAVRDLVRHIGGVHRWAASFLTTGRDRPTSTEEDDVFFTAPPDDRLLAWFRVGHAALVHALVRADPAVDCWTFLPAPSPLAFWSRRQAHETAIHRVDAESALGPVTAIDAEFAADGIDELLTGFLARPRGRLVADPPVSLCVLPTDVRAAWTVRIEPGRRIVTRESAPATCTVSGPAAALYLLLWNRGGVDEIAVDGDSSVLDLWRANATVRWS